jgi:hypothetical protein
VIIFSFGFLYLCFYSIIFHLWRRLSIALIASSVI